jgi:hypothetical protein
MASTASSMTAVSSAYNRRSSSFRCSASTGPIVGHFINSPPASVSSMAPGRRTAKKNPRFPAGPPAIKGTAIRFTWYLAAAENDPRLVPWTTGLAGADLMPTAHALPIVVASLVLPACGRWPRPASSTASSPMPRRSSIYARPRSRCRHRLRDLHQRRRRRDVPHLPSRRPAQRRRPGRSSRRRPHVSRAGVTVWRVLVLMAERGVRDRLVGRNVDDRARVARAAVIEPFGS